MTRNRSTGAAGRRLRVESLEERAVPATEADAVLVLLDDPTKPAIVDETPPVDVILDDTMVDGELDPDIIFTTQIDDEPATDTTIDEIDLSATAVVDKIKPSIGDVVTVTVTVKNNSLNEASDVSVSAELPTGLTFVSATPAEGTGEYDAASGGWAVGTVGAGESVVLTIKAKVMDPTVQVVAASIAAAEQPDPDETNNSAEINVTPVLGGVTLTKKTSATTPVLKSTVAFTLTVRNAGPGMARDIVVTDTLGTGLTFVRALAPTRGVFVPSTKTWTFAKLPAGTSATIQIIAQVTGAGRIESPATMTATGIDPERSTLDAMSVVTGVRLNVPATWSYHAGPNFRPGPAPVPTAVRPAGVGATPPARPILPPIPTTSLVGQLLLQRGIILPGLTMS
jgi:uncharacterized repeat protein (TIGR01451 family)